MRACGRACGRGSPASLCVCVRARGPPGDPFLVCWGSLAGSGAREFAKPSGALLFLQSRTPRPCCCYLVYSSQTSRLSGYSRLSRVDARLYRKVSRARAPRRVRTRPSARAAELESSGAPKLAAKKTPAESSTHVSRKRRLLRSSKALARERLEGLVRGLTRRRGGRARATVSTGCPCTRGFLAYTTRPTFPGSRSWAG